MHQTHTLKFASGTVLKAPAARQRELTVRRTKDPIHPASEYVWADPPGAPATETDWDLTPAEALVATLIVTLVAAILVLTPGSAALLALIVPAAISVVLLAQAT